MWNNDVCHGISKTFYARNAAVTLSCHFTSLNTEYNQELNTWHIRRSTNSFSREWRCRNVSKYGSPWAACKTSDEQPELDVLPSVPVFPDGDASPGVSLSMGCLTGCFKRPFWVASFVSGILEFSWSCDKRDNVTHRRWSSLESLLPSRPPSASSLHYQRHTNNCEASSGEKSAGAACSCILARSQKGSIYLWGGGDPILQRGQETFLSDGASRLRTQRR